MVPAQFRQRWVIRELRLESGEPPIRFGFDGPTSLGLVLSPAQQSDFDEGHTPGTAFCAVSSMREISDEVCNLLAGMPTYPMLSGEARRFVDDVAKEHSRAVQGVVRVLRWRAGAENPPEPFSVSLPEWSGDGGKTWTLMPMQSTVRMWDQSFLSVPDTMREEVVALVIAGETEPTAHHLFREAWELRRTHGKSSITIGMAALEVGAKQTMIHFAPDARWLVENVPSPDVLKVIREGVPELMKAKGLPVPYTYPAEPKKDAVARALQKGITLRNEVVHRDSRSPSFETLLEVLEAVRDLLWVFDLARGHQWARGHIRASTLSAWLL